MFVCHGTNLIKIQGVFKMKKIKKVLAVILSGMLIAGIAAGCASNKSSESK